MLSKEKKEVILALHKQGYSNIQIKIKTGVLVKTIVSLLNRNGLKSNRYFKLKDTKILKQLIIGSMLGDGHLVEVKSPSKNSRLTLGHSIKQLSYLQSKVEILKGYDLNCKITKCVNYSDRYKKGYCVTYHTKSKTHPIFTYYRKVFYPNNIKIVPDEVQNLEPFGLAVWFQDDAHKCTRSYQINSQGFSVNDCNKLRQILHDKYSIDTTLQKNNIIYVKTTSINTLNDLITPFMSSTMTYKLKKGPE